MLIPTVHRPDPEQEYYFHERCWILESWNVEADGAVSIARARVEPGVTTKPHRLRGVVERYLIVEGTGVASIGELDERTVGPGDVVVIPEGVIQEIRNDGSVDLVFYCICTPRFTKECYESAE